MRPGVGLSEMQSSIEPVRRVARSGAGGVAVSGRRKERSTFSTRALAKASTAVTAGGVAWLALAAAAVPPADANHHVFCTWATGSMYLFNPYGSRGGPYTCVRDQAWYTDIRDVSTYNDSAHSGTCVGVNSISTAFRHYSSIPFGQVGKHCQSGGAPGRDVYSPPGVSGYPYVHDPGRGSIATLYVLTSFVW